MIRTPETSDPGIRSAAGEASEGVDRLAELLRSCRRLLVLTGAGCSTASGIPDYRDFAGNWKSQQPMAWRAYVSSHAARQRYWARSSGVPRVPNSPRVTVTTPVE